MNGEGGLKVERGLAEEGERRRLDRRCEQGGVRKVLVETMWAERGACGGGCR